MKRNHSGFTLIEIAIVLVIIGLLLGGVLKGQELINSAKVKNLASDFKNIPLFIYGYQDKYRALPGDDAAAGAHVSGVIATTGGVVGDGRIDGNWNTATRTDESYLFWQHVRQAGLVAGTTDKDAADYIPKNAVGGIIGIQNGGTSTPITNLRGSYVICSSGIAGKFAKQLDTTMDDGNPTTGSMMITGSSAVPAAAISAINDNDNYNVCMGV